MIAWNGTSSGWLGFGTDEALCARITEETGIPACTSVLALDEAMRLSGRLAGVGTRRVQGWGRLFSETPRH